MPGRNPTVLEERPPGERAPRMSRPERREQLLDVAAQLLVHHGAQSVTMERLAEWAGVSKALPYAHFENSNDVLLALRDRETARVAQHMWDAAAAADAAHRIEVVVDAYLDAVEHSADLLGVLAGPGAIVTNPRDRQDRLGPRFVAGLLEEQLGVGAERATAIAPTLLGSVIGAAEGWGAGDADRETTKLLVVAVLESLLMAD